MEILQVEVENQKVCMMCIMTTAAVNLHSRVGKEKEEQFWDTMKIYLSHFVTATVEATSSEAAWQERPGKEGAGRQTRFQVKLMLQ